MRKIIRKCLAAAAVVAAGIALTAAPAYAGPPWTVTGAPAPTPAGSVSATSSNTFLQFSRGSDPTPVTTLRCETVTFNANIINGTYNTVPADIGDIISSTWSNCRDDGFGLTFTVNPVHPWDLSITADGPGPNARKVVIPIEGSISGPGCMASYAGNAPGHYDDSGNLVLDPADGTNTVIVTSANCLGIIQAGDRVELRGIFTVTPVYTITG